MERLKVMVVDDESRMRKLVKDFLVKKNFEVLEAENGAKAIEAHPSSPNTAWEDYLRDALVWSSGAGLTFPRTDADPMGRPLSDLGSRVSDPFAG